MQCELIYNVLSNEEDIFAHSRTRVVDSADR